MHNNGTFSAHRVVTSVERHSRSCSAKNDGACVDLGPLVEIRTNLGWSTGAGRLSWDVKMSVHDLEL
jgi:hypothetical protein